MKMCLCTIIKIFQKFGQAWKNTLSFTTGKDRTRDLNTGRLMKCIMLRESREI